MSIPEFSSLVELLDWRAARHPNRRLHAFLLDGQNIEEELDYETLARRSSTMARALLACTRPGQRVMLLHPFGSAFPVAFFACLRAGLAAVPAYPPDPGRPNQNLDRITTMIRDSDPALIITSESDLAGAQLARKQSAHPDSVTVLTIEELEASGESDEAVYRAERDLPAFIQYTSGTTRRPRGSIISHGNLIDHQRGAHPIFRCPEASLTVSWLPLFHDMGLIGPLLYPLYCGGSTLFLPPMTFLRRPLQWLRVISAHGAGISTAPNFAYEQCLARATDEDLADLDLSTWFLTVCGAEPLDVATLRGFSERFARCGFRAQTFLPCYGLAEATLMVTGDRLDAVPTVGCFDRRELRLGRVRLAPDPDAEHAVSMVGCGASMQGHGYIIVDPESGEVVDADRSGEIWIEGPSVSCGYVTPQSIDAKMHFVERIVHGERRHYCRTGDRGFSHAGQLFVLGRLADELEDGGRYHQAHDLESSANAQLARLTRARCVAVSHEGPRILVEARRSESSADLQVAAQAIYSAIRDEHGLDLAGVDFIPQRCIEKTTSGKLRRFAYRESLQRGTLTLTSRWTPESVV